MVRLILLPLIMGFSEGDPPGFEPGTNGLKGSWEPVLTRDKPYCFVLFSG
jgi:hypothetical protein